MTQQRDVELLLDQWFSDGPSQAPDRVVDIVADRIERQSQRPAWRLQRRPFSVNAYSKIAVAAAAVLIVAIVSYNLIAAGSTGVGGPAPSPSPTASPPPTATPTGTAIASGAAVALYDGVLPAGRYRIRPFSDLPSLSIVADIPAGWIGYPDVPGFTSPGGSNEGALIGFMRADGLFRDPCRWDLNGSGSPTQAGDVVVGSTVDDLVAALEANASYTTSKPTPVTFGAFQGSELQLQLPGDDVLSTCDGDRYWVFSGISDAGFYSQGPDSRWQLSIVEVNGTRLIALVSFFEKTPQADLAAAQAIMDSIQITP